jgi:hypothetical protein
MENPLANLFYTDEGDLGLLTFIQREAEAGNYDDI